MTLREAAAKLQSEYGRAVWFSACGVSDSHIFLYVTKSSILGRSLEKTGYEGHPVTLVIMGALTN